MSRELSPDDIAADEAYQSQALVHVSRTFALTIPQLPGPLRRNVTTAYLLCRIADTIEDEPALSAAEKRAFLDRFSGAVAGREAFGSLSTELRGHLSAATLPAEHELVEHLDGVIAACHRQDLRSQAAMARCIQIMCGGMHDFQRGASVRGLKRVEDLDRYCYHVAGVVGEMLTELFCASAADIDAHGRLLHTLSPSFGQGLQMTNILKDMWEDRRRGACWLPQEVFDRVGLDLGRLVADSEGRLNDSLKELIGIAHGHLRHALDYTLTIPARHVGIRRFCAWAIGLALLTLRSIQEHPGFSSGAEVKIKRWQVMVTMLATNATIRSNTLLTRLFDWAARDLPLVVQTPARSWGERVLSSWEPSDASLRMA